MNFILHGKLVVAEPDYLTWARWFENADRSVACTELSDGIEVITQFTGLGGPVPNRRPRRPARWRVPKFRDMG
jgi:hypothetical protein